MERSNVGRKKKEVRRLTYSSGLPSIWGVLLEVVEELPKEPTYTYNPSTTPVGKVN